jgi:predicted HNH restriction endonuclease
VIDLIDWKEITIDFSATCSICEEKINAKGKALYAKGPGAIHPECKPENDILDEYTIHENFTMIPQNQTFKTVTSPDKILELQLRIEQYFINNSKPGQIRLTKEDTSTYHNDKTFPVVNAYFHTQHDVWWSNAVDANFPPPKNIFKNIFGVGNPNWRPSQKNSYFVLSVNFNKDGSQRTAGILLEDNTGDYFLAIDERIDGNYETHNKIALHKMKDEIQTFFSEKNHSISASGTDRHLFLIAKIDEDFVKTMSEFVKNIKNVKDYFLKYSSDGIEIKNYDVHNRQIIESVSPNHTVSEIRTFELDPVYEERSNELIEKFTKDNLKEKLSEFESSEFVPEKQDIQTSTSFRNPELASLMKIKQNHTCQICEIPTFKNKNGNYYTESHHIIPRSLGGPDKPSNILIVCANCHRKFDSGDESTLVETYAILKQKNIFSDFGTLKKSNAISENLFNKLN